MIKRLSVINFAIIEDLTYDFENGMTVLTGETGAGKSLIIDTISLLLGSRADTDMIRYGATKATIEGVFTYQNKNIDIELDRLGVSHDKELVIKREISKGNSSIKINDETVNLLSLKAIAYYLADIHVQNDTYRLINPDTYLSFIDLPSDESFSNIYNSYQLALVNYTKDKQDYLKVLNGKKNSLERLEFLEYEAKELKALDLQDDEDILLNEKISKLSNYNKIFTALNEAYKNLENDYFSLDNIYEAKNQLEHISSYDTIYKEASDLMGEAYYNLTDAKEMIRKSIDGLDYDDNLLDTLNERLNEIESIKKKYKKSISELKEYLDKITLEINMVTNYDDVLKDKYNKLFASFNVLRAKAMVLSNYRKNRASSIEKVIENECKDLELPNTKFEIQFNTISIDDPIKSEFKETGIDVVDFMISLNKGEPLKSLHKTASGGEMSRIMLAFKSCFSKEANLSLMVFDEIDTGVSGIAATEIAKKMKAISKNTQVLCITHLPQVASIADHHLFIFKEENNDRTTTHIKELFDDERIMKIAMMLSGKNVSKYAIDHAKELLNESQNS